MNTTFNLNNNKHIFIYWDCNSHSINFFHWLLRVYEHKKWLHIFLADTTKVGLRNYENIALFGRVCTDIEDFLFHFDISNEMSWKRIIFIYEISDYIRDPKYWKKFKKILKDILDWNYMDTNIIFKMQPSFLNEIEWIYNHENVIMFDFNN
jgi:hypothetical protein